MKTSRLSRKLALVLAGLSAIGIPGAPIPLHAQTPHTNLDEAKVKPYTLPSALQGVEGGTIHTSAEWESGQRARVLRDFAQNIYGRMPGPPPGLHAIVDRTDSNVLDGLATRSEVRILLGTAPSSPAIHMLLYLPAHPSGRVPVFVGLNFLGNHSVASDEEITIQQNWLQARSQSEAEKPVIRGIQASRWPMRELVQRGYGVATAWYGDLEVDKPEGYRQGVRTELAASLQVEPHAWGAVGAWAWGMSRMADYLETNPAVDARRIIVIGHSRLGKAALWAGANDRRFAMVVSNDSGEGGAALARRNFGETIADLNQSFPHWFVPRYRDFDGHPERMPMDQHMLLSLIAPRPLYLASATEDLWSDPKGEFLSAQAAGAVYSLYGYAPLPGMFPPAVNTSIGDRVGYHLRTGKHDITLLDWMYYADFADRKLKH